MFTQSTQSLPVRLPRPNLIYTRRINSSRSEYERNQRTQMDYSELEPDVIRFNGADDLRNLLNRRRLQRSRTEVEPSNVGSEQSQTQNSHNTSRRVTTIDGTNNLWVQNVQHLNMDGLDEYLAHFANNLNN